MSIDSYRENPDKEVFVMSSPKIMRTNMDRVKRFRGNYKESRGKKANVQRSRNMIGTSLRSCLGRQLLPGIADEVTLEFISPKLSLADLHLLWLASPDWAKAIDNGVIYKARIRTQSRETFAVFRHRRISPKSGMVISLYSMRDGSWHQLPAVPGNRDIFHCVGLDDKLYILEGLCRRRRGQRWRNKEVFVFHPAGARKWKRCAKMLESKTGFGAFGRDGKIFVLGGYTRDDLSIYDCRCEIYDPKIDAWSWIKPKPEPMTRIRYSFHHQIAELGEELILYGQDWRGYAVSSAQVYHPVEDKWRSMDPFGTNMPKSYIFSVKGRFYAIKRKHPFGISLCDTDKQAWRHFQTCKFPDLTSENGKLYDILVVDDEVIAMMDSDHFHGFLRSRGFGQEHAEVVWEHIRTPHDGEDWFSLDAALLCCIQV